jgi:G:T-mismatch repair DNA endonuclease (very short patch repair protein)
MPELPHLSVDGFCPETIKVYEFLGCYLHGHTCLSFRDVTTMVEGTLSDRYEQTMSRLAQITQAGYQVEVQWECEFDSKILPRHPELKTHPIVQHSPLKTRDAL